MGERWERGGGELGERWGRGGEEVRDVKERKQYENIKSTNLLTFFFLIRFLLFDCSRYWILKYDTSIWRDFVVCYNAPGFPILVLQLFTDEFVAKRVGTRGVCLLHLFLISWLDGWGMFNLLFVVLFFYHLRPT